MNDGKTGRGYLCLEGLGKSYPAARGPAVIVHDVNLAIEEGEAVALIGHSGCGKSTVLSMIAGLTPITDGVIRVGGRPIRGPGADRGVVFQAPCLLPWMNALDNVLLGLESLVIPASLAGKRARAEKALRAVGLGDALAVRPASLSAGMRQRVALARALAREPRTLLLDEPFGMLDSVTRAELQDLVLGLRVPGPTILLVTHDIDEALLLADRVVVMTDGPAATIRAVIDVPFGRPREREQVLAHAEYERLRDRLHDLLDTGVPGVARAAGASRAA